jgi:hypothetical protein
MASVTGSFRSDYISSIIGRHIGVYIGRDKEDCVASVTDGWRCDFVAALLAVRHKKQYYRHGSRTKRVLEESKQMAKNRVRWQKFVMVPCST